MSRTQLDMFGETDDMFPDQPVVYRPDPDKVRRRLERILAEARAAQSMPWDRSKKRLYQQIFPQMTNWLPEEEAAQYKFAFEEEIRRLEAA